MKRGNAYLLYDDEDSSSIPHLHVVISDPDENGCIVLVSFTSERAKSDTMTRLQAGIHPYVDRPSVIAYNYSKMMTCEQLARMIATGNAMPKSMACEEIVRRAQAGMVETRRAPREVQECFLEWIEKHPVDSD